MGSGKSTIAKLLYQKLNRLVLDSDSIISNNENLTISEIFSQKGEEYFRKCEKEFCNFVSKYIQNCILATGGGMPIFCDVKPMGKVFFLQIDFQSIFSRLSIDEIKTRPLLDNPKNALKIYQQRQKCYEKSADFIINANQTPENITKDILRFL